MSLVLLWKVQGILTLLRHEGTDSDAKKVFHPPLCFLASDVCFVLAQKMMVQKPNFWVFCREIIFYLTSLNTMDLSSK